MHPESKYVKKHINLKNKIKKIIYNNTSQNSFDKEFSIFIGSTSSIIEALNKKLDVYHIMENVEFEIYSKLFWPNIKNKFISDRIVNYSLISKNLVTIDKNYSFNDYQKNIRL